MGDYVPIAAIVLLVLLGPWVLLWRARSRRKRERAEDQERWRELTSRTYALEQAVLALQTQRSGSTLQEAAPAASESPIASLSPWVVSPHPARPVVDRTVEPSPSVRMAERWVTEKTAAEPATPSTPDQSVPPAHGPVSPLHPPSFTTVKSGGPSLADRFKSSLDVEEMLGTN